MVSRNRPLAFVVGVAGFLGSNLADKLLAHSVQVFGVDDFSTGKRYNLEAALKDKDFHLLEKSIADETSINVPRVDYAFFVADSSSENLFTNGLDNFLKLLKGYKDKITQHDLEDKSFQVKPKNPRIILASSINLYAKDLDSKLERLKHAEIRLASFAKENDLNARIVRLAPLFGPRMHFREDDALIRLIEATLREKLNEEQTSLEFSSRALYIDDAVHLLLKTVFLGGTARKIYDGALPSPIKVSELKQILLDPLWHEEKGFTPSELPPWTTPNLKKTIKELSWKPKVGMVEGLRKTLAYFASHEEARKDLEKNIEKEEGSQIKVLEPEVRKEEVGRLEKVETHNPFSEFNKGGKKRHFNTDFNYIKTRLFFFLALALISYGLIFPIVSLTVGSLSIKSNIKNSKEAVERGDFERAQFETKQAKASISQMRDLLSALAIVQRLGVLNGSFTYANNLLATTEDGIDGIDHANKGMKSLVKASKVISGEDRADPAPLYKDAQLELETASEKVSKVKINLQKIAFVSNTPEILRPRAQDLETKLNLYSNLIDKAKTASELLPTLTAVNTSPKKYLILLQNNLELRPTGGFIGSYAKIEFEKGRIKRILVDDVYSIDGNLKEHIEPPQELKTDLGQNNWYLRDSNFDPDFPTSARQANFFYNKEAGEQVNGVFAMDLTSSGKLIDAVGGLELSDYNEPGSSSNEKITGDNLFQKAITHAEVGFFPGSQAKKNFLTALETQLFNKLFFLSSQNWPAIVGALGQSLEQKHLLIYLADPKEYAYVVSQNWTGAIPRPTEEVVGETKDFLSVVEANMGANKVNYYLKRKYNLATSFGKDGEVVHNLTINYKNTSPSDVFPAGKYKNRLRFYVPIGANINRVNFGEKDITQETRAFSDYGRSGFSLYIELLSKEEKNLVINYQLAKPLSFKDDENMYRLDVIKQPGTDKDSFDWNLTHAINYSIENSILGDSARQELNIATDLSRDRSFKLKVKKK